jgi:hypothetical protein
MYQGDPDLPSGQNGSPIFSNGPILLFDKTYVGWMTFEEPHAFNPDGAGRVLNSFIGQSERFRSTTDRNSEKVKEYRRVQKLRFELTQADTKEPISSRVWQPVSKRFGTIKGPKACLRLKAIKMPKFKIPPNSQLLVNDLTFWESNFTCDFFRDMKFRKRRVYPGGYPDPNTVTWTVHVIGDIVACTQYLGYKTWTDSGGLHHEGASHEANSAFSNGLFLSNAIAPPNNYTLDSSTLGTLYASRISEADDKSLTRFYKKLKDQKLDLATGLAELSQTAGMISAAAIKLGESFLLAKAGKLGAAFSILFPKTKEDVASLHLAYRYGVNPLVSDIVGAAEHLAQLLHDIAPVRIKTKDTSYTETEEEIVIEPAGYNTITGINTITRTSKVIVKYSARYRVKFAMESQLSRLGFTNPTNVAWELVPFSFVIDWFYPIGNYLSSLDSLEGLELMELTRTVFIKDTITCKTTYEQDPDELDAWLLPEGLETSWTIENVYNDRRVLDPAEIASLSLPPPRFKNPFSTGHVANAIALVTQIFSGKK